MSVPRGATGFAVGIDILRTVIQGAGRTILAQIGDVLTEKTDADTVEWWQHVGFISRPPAPEAGKAAAQGIAVRGGAGDVIFASRDLRGQELAGNLEDGETCIYGAGTDGGAQGRVLIKKNGSVNLYTRKGNTKDGGGMAIMVNPDDDSISIVNSKGYGIIIDGDGVKITSKEAGLTLASSGEAKLVGRAGTQIDGPNISLGSLATPATPVLMGPTGIAGVASTKVFASLA